MTRCAEPSTGDPRSLGLALTAMERLFCFPCSWPGLGLACGWRMSPNKASGLLSVPSGRRGERQHPWTSKSLLLSLSLYIYISRDSGRTQNSAASTKKPKGSFRRPASLTPGRARLFGSERQVRETLNDWDQRAVVKEENTLHGHTTRQGTFGPRASAPIREAAG